MTYLTHQIERKVRSQHQRCSNAKAWGNAPE